MNVLLSIKPEFAEKILNGEKQYEFRKTVFRNPQAVERVYLYASNPAQRIVGSFTVEGVIQRNPHVLWNLYREKSGISDKERFMNYFSGDEIGYAIEVADVERLSRPVDPRDHLDGFRPPVSFQYIDSQLDVVLECQ